MASENGNALLQFEPGLMIWTVVTFLFTFVALRLIAWKPLLGALEEREDRIQESLDQAKRAQAEAEQAIAENKSRMEASLRESQELVAQARQAADRVRAQAKEEAREEARRILEEGRRQLQVERQTAVAELQRESASMAIRVAERLLRRKLDDRENRRLVEEFLRQLPEPPSR